MLHNRFLPPGLLSVLQFYFAAEFEEVQVLPTIQIALPPNTRLYSDDMTIEPPADPALPQLFDNVALSSLSVPNASRSRRSSVPDSRFSDTQNPSGGVTSSADATMHLGRMVSLIQGCKEAIWKEFMELEPPPPTTVNQLCDLRDEFDAAWLNWEW